MSETKLNNAWNKLFERYEILSHIEKYGEFIISTDQIRVYREPRLMAKFDHTINLPKIFSENSLSILPINRNNYIISHFDAYHNFEPSNSSVERVQLPSYLQSLDSTEIKSEEIALNCAYATGIIAQFTEDEELLPTVSGRMGAGTFRFNINDTVTKIKHSLEVSSSQVEIDAAYEGINYLSIFEAKRDISKDFIVRQLYYPYRIWANRVTKKVKPIFMVYSNGIFKLYEYTFLDQKDYGSITLIKQNNYTIEDVDISTHDIQNILDNVKIIPEPEIPFPQADMIERVINICELLNENDMDRNEITDKYDFDERQTNYYTDAGRYLGLIEKNSDNKVPKYSLTPLSKKILNLNFRNRQLAICNLILSHKVFNDVLREYFSNGNMPEKSKIIQFMKNYNLYGIKSDQTYSRRASSVKHWIEWIVGIINN